MDFNQLAEGVKALVILTTETNKAVFVKSTAVHVEGKVYAITVKS